MLRLSVFCLVPALLTAGSLTALAQTPTDSVVRTTTVVTTTTTTVTKPAVPGSKPAAPVTTSSTSSTTTTEPAPAATSPARPPAATTTATAKPAATARPAATATTKPAATTAAKPKTAATAVPTTRTTTTAAARRTTTTPADPELAHFLQTDVDLTLVRAEQLPNLYERFMETTRAERRQWTTAQWTSASAVLARLNQRYEQVRADLSLEEKLNIRTLQGEFRGLEAAKTVSKRL